jgi:GNAT superfamily N-acetyltransferase
VIGATIDQAGGERLQRRSLARFVRMLVAGAEDSSLFERQGVAAAVVPSVPIHSIPNSVFYDTEAHLIDAIGDLATAYSRAGVQNWMVWVPETDEAAVAALQDAGFVLDGSPAAMSGLLEDLDLPVVGDLDWDSAATGLEVGRVNDLAYGWTDPGVGTTLRDLKGGPSTHLYRARVGGETASVAIVADVGEEASLFNVATDPAHQRQGLSSRLVGVALAEARERGMRTSTLQASAAGEPVYAKLGYQGFGRLQMWEHRT